MQKVQGFTLSEVTIATSVIAAIIIPSLDFYDKSVAVAQLSGVFPIAKLISDNVSDSVARFESLPQTGQNLAGTYVGQPYDEGDSVETAKWFLGDNLTTFNGGAQWGYVEVTIKDGTNRALQQTIRGHKVRFYYVVTQNKSFLTYLGCTTSINAGMLDGTQAAPNNGKSPYLPECYVGLDADYTMASANMVDASFFY